MRLVRSRTAERPLRAAGAAAVMSLVVACLVVAVPLESYGADHGLRLEVVSTRADMVTGGNALVAVSLGQGMNPEDVHVTAGYRDVTDDFQERSEERRVGKECRSRWAVHDREDKKNVQTKEGKEMYSENSSGSGGGRGGR